MRRKLLILSIDGLQPDAVLDRHSICRFLKSLAARGAWARSLEPAYPSVTFPNHVTIATGVSTGVHGIYSNTRFEAAAIPEWKGGESRDWFFDAKDVKVPSLWDVAHSAGLRTALIRWPVTLGARADWLIPEIFKVPQDREEDWRLHRKHSTPSLMEELGVSADRPPLSHFEYDKFSASAATHLLSKKSDGPDLMMVHLNAFDHASHEFGAHGSGAMLMLKRMEELCEKILSALNLREWTVFVLGDHGFADFRKRVHLNALFAERGWLKVRDGRIEDWQVLAHTACAQAAVHVKDPSLKSAVLETLYLHAAGHYRVVPRATLDEYRAFPGAFCAVDCKRGFSMGQRLEGPLIETLDRPRGEHGYATGDASMSAAFVAAGAGVSRGLNLGRMHMVDVAPTAARVLGVTLPQAEGAALDLSKSAEHPREVERHRA